MTLQENVHLFLMREAETTYEVRARRLLGIDATGRLLLEEEAVVCRLQDKDPTLPSRLDDALLRFKIQRVRYNTQVFIMRGLLEVDA